MGRKTLESLPGGQPLAGRTNVVLTRDPGFQKKGCEIFHSLGETLEYLKQFASEQFLPYCDTAHITWIDYEYEADCWFPNLDRAPGWTVTAVSDEQTYFDLCYEFRRYEKNGID